LNWAEPISAVQCLADQPQLTFLDSALRHEQLGRYSYIACEPFGTYVVADGRASWNGAALPGDPFEALRARLTMYGQDPHSKEERPASLPTS
jgi:para-aminobenzoate synthetase component 1